MHKIFQVVSTLRIRRPQDVSPLVSLTKSISLACSLFVLMFSTLLAPLASAATGSTIVGPKSAGLASDNAGTGTTAWTTPTSIYTSNGVYATQKLTAATAGHYLVASAFGFNIPVGATVDGVTVDVQKKAASSNKGAIVDNSVKLVKAGSVTGDSQASTTIWPSSNNYVTYGGSSTTWGAALTSGDINASNFGVAVSAKNNKLSGSGATLAANVDHIRISVSYTLPATLNQASYRLFDNQDAASAPTTALNFAHTNSYYGDSGSNGIATADLNGDGIKDIAMANNASSTVSVLLGTGSGHFKDAINYATGTNPYDIVAGDFSGDGKIDLATADFGANKVSILVNKGTGTFTTHVDYNIGIGVQALTTADFNGDGKLDIATANYSANTTSVLINKGSGVFAPTVNYYAGSGPNDVTTADFNADGKIDLAVANNNSSSVSVFLNNGSGSFASKVDYVAGSGAYGIASADLNGDGKADLVTANATASTTSVFINTGTGNFAPKVDYPTGATPHAVTTSDFNGDGNTDLAVTNNADSTVSVLLGNGSGTFGTKSDFAVDYGPDAIVAADLDADGKTDLATVSYLYASVSELTNTSVVTASPIDVGTPLAAENATATLPASGQPFRLRLNVGASTAGIAKAGQSFKLQYAPMTTSCDASFVDTLLAAYSDVTTSSAIGYYDNTNAPNGTSFAMNANDPTDGANALIRQTYQESGTSTFVNANAIAAGQDGMWDFALTTNSAAAGSSYCLRVVKTSGNLDSYAVIPQVTTAADSTVTQ